MDIDNLIFATSARVTVRATSTALLQAAQGRAPDPSVFDQYPPFFFSAEISSDRLDAYYTIMDAATTLPNYARDAAAGVAVLLGHDTYALPVGASLSGALETIGDVTRVTSDAYILQEPDTLAVVSRIRAGIARDVSVGFTGRRSGAKCICSICGLDMWRSWDCWHIPGFEYETEAPASSAGSLGGKSMQLCTGLIVNASLAEYSLVYDGATPGAAVIQAQKAAEAGRMPPEHMRIVEQRYKIALPNKRLVVRGSDMGAENNGKAPEAGADERYLLGICERAGVPADLTGLSRIEWMADQLAELRPLAEDGRAYRAALRQQAAAEAIRAFGAEAAADYQTTIDSSSIALVQKLTEAWRMIGDSKLPGGRRSVDERPADEGTWQPITPTLPSGMY